MPQAWKAYVSEIANQQTGNDSLWRDTQSADLKTKAKIQRQNHTSKSDRHEDVCLEPVTITLRYQIVSGVDNEAG